MTVSSRNVIEIKLDRLTGRQRFSELATQRSAARSIERSQARICYCRKLSRSKKNSVRENDAGSR
jgi:hypothetical protein